MTASMDNLELFDSQPLTGAPVPRRGLGVPLRRAAQLAGVSHRSARTAMSYYAPILGETVTVADLPTLKVLVEVLLFTPPAGSEQQPTAAARELRDENVARLARQINDERRYSGMLVLYRNRVVPAWDPSDVAAHLQDEPPTGCVVILPAGLWAQQIHDRLNLF